MCCRMQKDTANNLDPSVTPTAIQQKFSFHCQHSFAAAKLEARAPGTYSTMFNVCEAERGCTGYQWACAHCADRADVWPNTPEAFQLYTLNDDPMDNIQRDSTSNIMVKNKEIRPKHDAVEV